MQNNQYSQSSHNSHNSHNSQTNFNYIVPGFALYDSVGESLAATVLNFLDRILDFVSRISR